MDGRIMIFKEFQKYTDISTCNGVKYFGRSNFSAVERIFWVFATFTVMGLASTVCRMLWNKFREKPIEILIERTNLPLAEFPFPSVTICPTNNIDLERAKHYLSRFMNGTDEATNNTLYDVIRALHLLRYPSYSQMRQYLKSSKRYLKKFDAMNLTDFMLSVLPRCEEIMEKCVWHGKPEPCCDMFTIQPTEEGFCYSFNDFTSPQNQKCPMYDINTLNVDQDGKSSCHPRFLTFSGSFSGLTVFTKSITAPPNFLKDNQTFSPGLTVMVSTAYEYPEAGSGNLLQTLPGETLQLEVKPVMLQGGEKLSRIAMEERLCMLMEESEVLLTPFYSQSSCYLTCRHNFIIQMCGCQLYFFYEPSRPVPLCKVSQLFCIVKYSQALQIKAPSPYSFSKPSIKDYPDCTCHSACEGTWYDLGIKSSNITTTHGINVTGLIDIYYARYGAIKYKRKLAFTREDLIVSLGGVANLFLGCSFISVSEVLYYFTRSACIIIYYHIVKSVNMKDGQQINPGQKGEPMPAFAHDRSTARNRKNHRDSIFTIDKAYMKQYKKIKSYELLKEFTQSSTIHGVQHIFREGETPLHRLIWSLFFSVCLLGATYLIFDSWKGYVTVPIAITVADTNYPLDGVYFPSVSVCPTNKVVRAQATEYLAEILGHWVHGDLRISAFLDALSALQHPLYHNMEIHLNRTNPEVLAKLGNINITHLMLKSLPSCNELFLSCVWQGVAHDCCTIFSHQRSEEGFCYSFNSFTSESNKNCIYKDNTINNENCTLLSTGNTGPRSGLEILLKSKHKRTVRVHHPNEYPEAGMGSLVPLNHFAKINIGIKPTITESTDEIRTLNTKVSGCYFKDSKDSEITKIYSQKSCLLECRMKFLLKQCGCLPYYITMKSASVTCNASQLHCIVEHQEELRFFRPPSDASKVTDDVKKNSLDCTQCLPTCNERQYDFVIDYTKDTTGRKMNYNAYIDVFYRSSGAVKYVRSMTYDFVQLLVNLGGIGGLFLGGSVLSLLEAAYWFSKAFLTYLCPVSKNKITASKRTQAKNVFITDQAWLN